MDFIAIDFETANKQNDSPCSLGITLVKNGAIVETHSYYINPQCEFSQYNIDIHGITPDMIKNSPTFLQVWQEVYHLFKHYPVVAHHAPFDMSVLQKVADRYNILLPPITYFCTLQLLKCNYPNFEAYNLSSVCSVCGFELDNHCCGSDSLAAAQIMLMLLNDESTHIYAYSDKPKLDLGTFSAYTREPDNYESIQSETRNLSTAHSNYRAMFETPDYQEAETEYDEVDEIFFDGYKFVLTGDFDGYSREEVTEMITERGGIVVSSVSRQTDYVIVAFQNVNVVKNSFEAKSKKIIKAEELRDSGAIVKIISDEVFMSFLGVEYG